MRVLHLSYDYGLKGTSGAPIAAARLHLAMLRASIDSHFLCVRKLEDGPNVIALPRSWLGQKLFYFYPRVCWMLTKLLFGKMLMPNLIPLPGFIRAVRKIKPDIVHIHLIAQDMVSYAQLEKLNCRFIYSLHDLTCVNAIEPHPCDDRRFIEGFTRQNSSAVERWMFNRKAKFINAISPVFTGPSDWVCQTFRNSLIGNNRKALTIHNIADPAFRYDADKLVPHSKFTILFGAYKGRNSPYKGWSDLEAALKLLPEEMRENTIVHVFGESGNDYTIDGVNIHFLGLISNTTTLVQTYHEADLFAFPSKWETQGMVKVEALLCGLPVVAFNRAACAESIHHKENGWVANDGDIAGYTNGLVFFYEKFKRGELSTMREGIADKAKDAFNEEAIIAEMKDLYNEVLAGRTKITSSNHPQPSMYS